MTDKIRAFILQHNMLHSGDHVICAVSGGKDSIAMLECLNNLKSSMDFSLSVAHFNHKLRGAEAERDEQFVVSFCQQREIPIHVGSGDVAAYASAHKLGTEEAARILRYDYLTKLDPCARIATAHTADDNIETILMHLTRGCGLHGLTGIQPVRDHIIRPLLTVSRAEIDAYLIEHSLPHVEDSSNASDDYFRNRLRHTILPVLKQENNRLIETTIGMVKRLSEDDSFLEAQVQNASEDALLPDGSLQISGFLRCHPAIQYRLLRQFLRNTHGVTAAHIEAIQNLCCSASPSAQIALPAGIVVRRSYNLLKLCTITNEPHLTELALIPGETVSFGQYRISSRIGTCGASADSNELAILLPQAGPLTIRSRQPGDRIVLSGGTKKVSRYMIDAKIPLPLRNGMPLLIHNSEVAAILPYIVSKNYSTTKDCQCLYITVHYSEESL